MKIGLAQINTTVGDFVGNCRKIVDAAQRAHNDGARLVLFPELAVCGYPAEDLLLRPAFLAAHDKALVELADDLPPDVAVLVGCLERNPDALRGGGRPLFNAAALIEDGLVRIVARKSLLPTYDIFDESRYFEPWTRPQENVITVGGTKVGIVICEDGWNDAQFFARRLYKLDPVECVVNAGAQVVVNLSASPWNHGKERFRCRMVQAASIRHRVPIVYVNVVGGNVGLQFDGGSLAIMPEGLAFQPRYFEEGVFLVDTELEWCEVLPERTTIEMTHLALVQGVRDYFRKFGFKSAVLGISGGIDSAVTAAIAAEALGPQNVLGLMMPSKFSTGHSLTDAQALANNLGIRSLELPITSIQEVFDSTLQPHFVGKPFDVTEENIQARARAVLLMAFANKFGYLLLTTGDKSECAVGYCTLYGDTAGALAVIADLWKTEVYEVARWINRDRIRIPESTIEKPPSPELKPNQLTTDSLPPYAELDPVLRCLLEDEMTAEATAARTGMARDRIHAIQRRIEAAEFKRYQYAPTIRVTERCWDGRHVPVAHRFVEGSNTHP